MRSRVEVFGGTLVVRSEGIGTTVTCVVPGIARLVSDRTVADI
jgi:signal transduction histidine kinase